VQLQVPPPAAPPRSPGERPIVIIPAYNEEEALGPLLDELRAAEPDLDVVVINDCSSDGTSRVARRRGVAVLDLPCNLGVGGAVQAGFRYAYERGYRCAVRIDGDGQHPPAEIAKLRAALAAGTADLVIGSRFAGTRSYTTTAFRYLGIKALALFLSIVCRRRVTDPTSGFWMLNRKLLYCFAHRYPTDYPEPEALALLRRQGYSYAEVPVIFRPRQAGQSSIRAWETFYYGVKVGLALVVGRLRPVETRYAKWHVPDDV
jgi:glycosyltransferase involved in cell wall biosynthesis